MDDQYIESISFEQYKRFKNQVIYFDPNVNAIAGTNGTCKSSLLHIISNSYKKCNKNILKPEASKCLLILNSLLNSTNPKIESLNRGDKTYNDPAPGVTNYYTCNYADGTVTPFRKHASSLNNRYSVKPYYKQNSDEKLKEAMIAYLGINRLFPFGEYSDDSSLSGVKKDLPSEYKEMIVKIYKKFTTYDISGLAAQKMGLIKNRVEFKSEKEGIDSNTISAGEDNLLIIITTLICLVYFKDSLADKYKNTPAILLIDEFDATLHPEFQIKLIDVLRDYSTKHGIQILFTTHSISLLNYMLDEKMHVIYLKDDVQSISVVLEIDKYRLEQYLKNALPSQIYIDRMIPVYSEDEETRDFIEALFNGITDESFLKVKSYLHLVEAKVGSDQLRNIFKNDRVSRASIHSICILDGDQAPDITNCIISLPGGKSPEGICFEWANKLLNSQESQSFWNESDKTGGITKIYFMKEILPNINESYRQTLVTENKKLRDINKALYKEYKDFYKLVMLNWVNDPSNKEAVNTFFSNLKKVFKKVAVFHNIDSKIW